MSPHHRWLTLAASAVKSRRVRAGRCGRQGEALAAYRHARRILVGDLGIEPGADLQALHQQILTADPAVAAPRAEGHRACDARGGRRRRAWPSLPQLTARRVSARRCTYRRRSSQ